MSNMHTEAWMGNGLTGIPLTQTLMFALHHAYSEEVDGEIVKCLVNERTCLDVDVICTLSMDSDDIHIEWCSIVQLGIQNKRMDVAKQLVMAGANPIHPSLDDASGVIQLLEEYYEFGTNQYVYWLLHQHLLSHELPQFIETVVNLDIINESCLRMFTTVGRHPVHAFLTCGHEEMANQFLKRHGQDLLYVWDTAGRTALQISAQKGDLESVNTLLKW